MQRDLFLAQLDNLGLTLLVRTGSVAFSTAMLARLKRRQGHGRTQPGSVVGRLVTREGRAVPTPEEEAVFRLLGTQPAPPERRSGQEWGGRILYRHHDCLVIIGMVAWPTHEPSICVTTPR